MTTDKRDPRAATAADPERPERPPSWHADLVAAARIGLALIDGQRRVVFANPCFCRFLGCAADAVAGLDLDELIAAESRDAWLGLFEPTDSAALRQHEELRWRRLDGETWWAGAVLAPPDGSGQRALQLLDAGPLRQAERALAASRRRLELLLDSGDMDCWEWDPVSNQVSSSRRLSALLGYELDEVGEHMDQWLPLAHPDDLAQLAKMLEQGARGEIDQIDTVLRWRHKDGGWRWIHCRGKIVEWSDDGRPLRAMGINLDVTAFKLAQQQLATAKRRLELATGAGHIGMYDMQLPGGFARANAEVFAIFGLLPLQAADGLDGDEHVADGETWQVFQLSADRWLQSIHPHDRERVAAQWAHSLAIGGDIDVQYRIVKPGGEVRYLRSAATLFREGDQPPTRCVGVVLDVSEQKDTERQLASTTERLQLAVGAGGMGVFEFDLASQALAWDGRMHALYGLDSGSFDGSLQTWLDCLLAEDAQCLAAELERALQQGTAIDTDFRIHHRKTGELRHIRALARVVPDSDGRALRMIGLNWDITARKHLEAQLFEEKERMRITLRSIGDAVVCTDSLGRITFLNLAAEQLTGCVQERAVGRELSSILSLSSENDADAPLEPVTECLIRLAAVPLPEGAVVTDAHGLQIAVHGAASPLHTASGQVIGAVLTLRDVSSARALQRDLAHSANHDALTGLPNRLMFERELRRATVETQGQSSSHVLGFIDLDRFKIVNDSAGHAAGDALLREIGQLLKRRTRDSDLIARIGGDEFALLLRNCDLRRGETVAAHLVEEIGALDFRWNGRRHEIGASIGLTSVAVESPAPDDLMSQADAACYAAKAAGRGQVMVYEGTSNSARRYRRENLIVSGFRDAIAENRFSLFAQEIRALGPEPGPQRHYEILLRMRDEHGGIIEPAQFVPAAERYGLMIDLDRWVIGTLLRNYSDALRDAPEISLAVNVSANSLSDPRLWPFVQNELRRTALSPGRLSLEITETALIDNLSTASAFIESARQAGCGITLDDFGAGLSSFGYLRRFPVDTIKIDGSFVRESVHNDVDRTIIASINAVAHQIGARTVAEHVEDAQTLELVRALGIDKAQGYAIAMPRALGEIFDLGGVA
ncbi:MAG: EAL domain-containing protein [Lysobacter sp.]